MRRRHSGIAALAVAGPLMVFAAAAQVPAGVKLPPGFKLPEPTPNDTLVSPEVGADRRITFRLYAPHASAVVLSTEIFDFGKTLALTKDAQGVWSVTTSAVEPGTYRYTYRADDITVIDPRNTDVSSTNSTVQSLVRVSGGTGLFEDTSKVPHGAVSAVFYSSSVTHGERRMHVYTPPGYDKNNKRYPVLYLLHGGGDADESWSTVGRAGFILDNLIAGGKSLPMIVVMPAGHVPNQGAQPPGMPAMGPDAAGDPFTADLLDNILPYIQAHYRISPRPQDRALAGLSMGGIQAANIGLTHPELFAYVGIFSSGWFPDVRTLFELRHGAQLDADGAKLRLLWVGYGATDVAHDNAQAMLQMFDRHQLRYTAHQSDGGHTWYNWRHYLDEFAPLLFK